jgi:hypothetical protein
MRRPAFATARGVMYTDETIHTRHIAGRELSGIRPKLIRRAGTEQNDTDNQENDVAEPSIFRGPFMSGYEIPCTDRDTRHRDQH